ncbi:MAG: DegT/DnrJ/EryC1/StrS family aminotransferase [Muricauda sp.]|nr:aminotransferase class I/II-fold pyridoxal phosphate-dependent enzyme [Allomuricauda sp.]MBO6532637.1 DegT/DnrJ/EryC1/StrS family aminotransferase [Allomuricauda sp.]MBO6589824.1 DegT/DnrJ/EryC1/StrS family aminotransferase [Allomuricauda sp.]MBO6619243.1 DegT/DnrJ/EryC1/StrS family aminotransferase [Allomuricauda sp.]MBO6645154.1 DegT/DnrJ/EryC1/StrS family aminotransferase [Allomuricauda sp.]MBO6747570.1 DegT/DnrJ/EryC1/StrS family aminotransferase [Allomuricauda sp.]
METTVLKKIWLSPPHMGGNEQTYVKEAFESNWIAPLGPNVQQFEKSIEEYVGNNTNAACLSSGTAAIHLSLELLGVGQGDEVICQSFTFAASANPITYLGANPVFVDSETDTWNISPVLLRKAIEDRLANGKKPKAIVAVHLYGVPYKVNEVHAVAKEFEIPVIEDSAEALGSLYRGFNCGSFGDFGILSFNGNKIITTSGGGALLCKYQSTKEKAVFLATQARDNAPHYQHSRIGYNYRMSNVLAGIGRGQMEVIQDRVEARRRNYTFYRENLSGLSEISFLPEPEHCRSNRWLTCILTPSFAKREQIRMSLENENIESRPLWKPMHLQPSFQKSKSYVDGTSEDLFNRGLCLPSGSDLSQDDMKRICGIIKNAIR